MGNDEREQTLNQLLTELDGFESGGAAAPVICIAATNRPDVRDLAFPCTPSAMMHCTLENRYNEKTSEASVHRRCRRPGV